MASYNVTFRKTGPVETMTVEAPTRERAIAQIVEARAKGEEFSITRVEEAGPEGAVGATGGTG